MLLELAIEVDHGQQHVAHGGAVMYIAQQRLNETMGRVLPNLQDKIYISGRADGKPRDLWLQLNREPLKSVNTNK
jgi:hypothetical protein